MPSCHPERDHKHSHDTWASKIHSAIVEQDLFGENINLNYEREVTLNTFCGGTFTLIL